MYARAFALLLALPVASPAQQSDGMEWKLAGSKFDASQFLSNLVAGTRHEHVMMPMRDGARMATEIFLPPETEKGPWPVVLMRTPYGRGATAGYAKRYKDAGVVFVTQDSRGRGDSEGKIEMLDNTNEIADGYDTVEWIATQKWCNGRVGMIGSSGHGMCARMAFLSKAPHLVVVDAANSAGNVYRYWSFENGVRRWMYRWVLGYRNGRDAGLHPTLATFDAERWNKIVADAAHDNHVALFVDDG
jgi:hypothetical protein